MLRHELHDGVARLVLDRPQARNALSSELIGALRDALDDLEGDRSAHVVVITGEGSAFSAGADLVAMKRLGGASPAANRADALSMGRLFHRIATFPKPVIAGVNGPAIGGGVGLMAACDVVIAAESAFFQFSEVRLGLVPAVISPFCIARLGAATARRLFLTGERIASVEALRFGLVDQVVDADGLEEAVASCTHSMRKGGPQALAAAKRLVAEVVRMDDAQALAYTAELIASLRASEEAQEGMQAFLDKRPASWARRS